MSGDGFTVEDLCRVDRAEMLAWRLVEEAAPSEFVALRDFGGPAGFVTKNVKNTLYNRALNVGAEDVAEIKPLCAWFKAQGVAPRIDVCPQRSSPKLEAKLRAEGLTPGGLPFFSKRVMLGDPKLIAEAVPRVTVRRVEPDELETFVAIQDATWKTDVVERRVAKARATHALQGLTRYFACIGGKPVAAGSLHVLNGMGYFNLAVTLEAFRKRGCQTALLRQRLKDAHAAGCDRVSSLTAADSGSQRNLERAGLRIACDRVLWMPPDWMRHPFYREEMQ